MNIEQPDPALPVATSGWSRASAVYADTYRSLLRVAFVITGSAAAAEDIVQTVFVRTGRRLDTIDEPLPYLRVAVVNECRAVHRRARRAPQIQEAQSVVMDVGVIELRDALLKLPVRQRAAIVLRYLCDLPEADIASALRCRPATVRSHIHRGLADLRKVL